MTRSMYTRAKFVFAFLFLVVFGAGISGVRAYPAQPRLTLDGVGTYNCQDFCQSSQLITTTKGHDAIILIVNCPDNAACSSITTITDSSGLTFVQRISYTGLCCFSWVPHIWEYYAIAASPLTLDKITVVAADCCVVIQVIAINGANTRAIFDPNSSTPATVSCAFLAYPGSGSYVNPCSASIQTSTIDFVIAATAINDDGPCGGGYPGGEVPGFTSLVPNPNGDFEIDYTITAVPRSTVVFDCIGTDATVAVVDAISFHGAFGTTST